MRLWQRERSPMVVIVKDDESFNGAQRASYIPYFMVEPSNLVRSPLISKAILLYNDLEDPFSYAMDVTLMVRCPLSKFLPCALVILIVFFMQSYLIVDMNYVGSEGHTAALPSSITTVQ